MSLIEKLIEIRFDIFIREFDITITDFDIHSNFIKRKNSWDTLKQKFIKCGYVTNENNAVDCYYIIKNIMWKNIMAFDVMGDQCCIYMYHNTLSTKYVNFTKIIPCFSCETLLGRHNYFIHEQKNNCDILQTKIINYIMLLDILVTEHMISDLVRIFKEYIVDVILIL